MERGKNQETAGSHRRAVIAAGIGMAGVAAVGAAAVQHRRKRRLNDLETYVPDERGRRPEQKAAIFNEPRLSKEQLDLLAEVAVRIHLATRDTAEVLLPKVLRGMLGNDVSRHTLQSTIGYLKGNDLIDTVPVGKGRRGYQALPALNWAIQQGDYLTLADAHRRILGESINDAIFEGDALPDYPDEEVES